MSDNFREKSPAGNGPFFELVAPAPRTYLICA
jgi:hypothetical protein